MSGCQCPDLCGRDHFPDDGCGRRARFIRSGLNGRTYHVCVECADVIVERGRGTLDPTRRGRTPAKRIHLNAADLALLVDALDAQAYWQLAEDSERHSGYVILHPDDAGDAQDCPADCERADAHAEIRRCEALAERLRRAGDALSTDDGLNHPDHGIATMPGEDCRSRP